MILCSNSMLTYLQTALNFESNLEEYRDRVRNAEQAVESTGLAYSQANEAVEEARNEVESIREGSQPLVTEKAEVKDRFSVNKSDLTALLVSKRIPNLS